MSARQNNRRAGLRDDELSPGENSGADQTGDEAAGSPSGAIGAGGIASLPQGAGEPGNEDFLNAEDPNEPQSGFTGGAVGGTPAKKRSTGS